MKKLLLHSTVATVFVFSVLVTLQKVSQLELFNAFDPIGKALDDLEFSDISFSQLREDPEIDTSIVMINIGYLSRAEIAQQIMMISQFEPKVIGIDGFFNCPGGLRDSLNCPMAYDTIGNTMLNFAIEQAGNVVLVTKLLQTDSLINALGDVDIYDSIEHTDDFIRGNAYEGFANLETDAAHQEDLKACRTFVPAVEVNGERQLAFSVMMAMLYDSAKTNRFLARGKKSEIINYRGNIIDPYGASGYPNRYYTLDWYQALDANSFVPGLFKDKIVIMGFLGQTLDDTSWDDKFFTPLNKQFAGKSRPDMYGAVVHANIVSMILNEDYIEELPEWTKIVIAIVVCYLNVALFWMIMQRDPDWFDGISILVQLLQFVAVSFMMVTFLSFFSFKLELTATLAIIAIVGTCFEIYCNVILTIWGRIKAKRMLTRKGEKVLTPVKD